MKKFNLLILVAFGVVLASTLLSMRNEPFSPSKIQEDSLAADREKFIKIVGASIKGREKIAADSVFKNIRTLKNVSAGKLLAIMDYAYSRSLGVSCGHCHNTNKWESDEKLQKQITREMSSMLTSTKELIKNIKGLKSENPTINCTTCHRGALKPALDLD